MGLCMSKKKFDTFDDEIERELIRKKTPDHHEITYGMMQFNIGPILIY